MAVSVTTRPATWSAVRNPVVYTFTTTGGPFVNYRIEVEVFKASDDSSLGAALSFSPDNDGVTYADISSILKSYLKPTWTKPSDTNEPEEDTSLEFYIKYQELYDGSSVSVVSDSANALNVVLAGIQIPSANGNNLSNYVAGDDEKKFLRVVDRAKLWRGYPFTLSFIFPTLNEGDNITRSVSRYNASGQLINTVTAGLSEDDAGVVNRLDLADVNISDVYSLMVKLINFNDDTSSLSDYTETFQIDIEDPCSNPVMLVWKNSLGGDSFWLFEHDQEVSYDISGSKKAKRMILSANNLTANEWEALNELNALGEVYKENIVEFTSSVIRSHVRAGAQVYMIDADGNRIGVIVVPTNNVMFTRMKRHQFRIEIELPERYE